MQDSSIRRNLRIVAILLSILNAVILVVVHGYFTRTLGLSLFVELLVLLMMLLTGYMLWYWLLLFFHRRYQRILAIQQPLSWQSLWIEVLLVGGGFVATTFFFYNKGELFAAGLVFLLAIILFATRMTGVLLSTFTFLGVGAMFLCIQTSFYALDFLAQNGLFLLQQQQYQQAMHNLQKQRGWQKKNDQWLLPLEQNETYLSITVAKASQLFFHPKPDSYYEYPNLGIALFSVSVDKDNSIDSYPSMTVFLRARKKDENTHAELMREVERSLAIRKKNFAISKLKVIDNATLALDNVNVHAISISYYDLLQNLPIRMIIFEDPKLTTLRALPRIRSYSLVVQLDSYVSNLHPLLEKIRQSIRVVHKRYQ